jgi:HlyD family secretion protein
MVAALAGAGGGGYYWWQHERSQLPPGIAFGNGRLEADAINIDTKYAGRIAELFADEGDLVKGRQIVALAFAALVLALSNLRQPDSLPNRWRD